MSEGMKAADSKRMVKVFSFGDSNQWEVMGTGLISKDYIEVTQGEMLTITVRSKEDNSIIIKSKVLPDRTYKMQEGTMIVWTENENCDIALSFLEKSACDELWMKICEVQGHLSEDGDLSDRFDDSWILPQLPPCELGKLDEILGVVTSVAAFPQRRETVALCIEKEDYIPKLLELFHICEDLDNLDGLHHLYAIFKTLFLFNNASLLQIMFLDDIIMDVIGCLEYNPSKMTPTRHRDYLDKSSKYNEVVEFSNPDLLTKIHQTYRIQYIQDVILPTPSLFEEHLRSALNSLVLFNKTEIIRNIQEDHIFLGQLFDQLCSDATSDTRYQQLVGLLREVCMFSLALEALDRTELFLKLSTYGFMNAIEGMLMYEDLSVVSTAVDILNLIAEFNVSILREHALQTKDNSNEDTHFLNIIISLLVDGEFTDIDLQLVNLIKSLINPENMSMSMETNPNQTTRDKTRDKSLYLNYFYSHCMPRLMAPLMAQTSSDTISKDTPQNAVVLSHILDILSMCVRVHTHHIRTYILDKNVLSRVLVLMMSSHGHLVLAALRFCRRIIGLKDEFYNRYIVYKNALSPIIQTFMANGRRYNLVNSAILELFNFIRQENVTSLVNYIVENFWSTLESVDYVDTFKNLKLKYDQAKEDLSMTTGTSALGNVIHVTRYRRDPRQLDEDEEAWFDEEEAEYIPFNTNAQTTPPTNSPIATPYPITPTSSTVTAATPISTSATPTPGYFISMLTSRNSPDTAVTSSTPSYTLPGSYSPRPGTVGSSLQMLERKLSPVPTISAALQSLVDYDEDSDEETSVSDDSAEEGGGAKEEEEDTSIPAKRQKLT